MAWSCRKTSSFEIESQRQPCERNTLTALKLFASSCWWLSLGILLLCILFLKWLPLTYFRVLCLNPDRIYFFFFKLCFNAWVVAHLLHSHDSYFRCNLPLVSLQLCLQTICNNQYTKQALLHTSLSSEPLSLQPGVEDLSEKIKNLACGLPQALPRKSDLCISIETDQMSSLFFSQSENLFFPHHLDIKGKHRIQAGNLK